MYIVYLANGCIVAELADHNEDYYSKDGTGKHGYARIASDVDGGQCLEPRALNAKMEKILGLLPVKLNMVSMILIHHCLAPVNHHAHRRI